MDVDEVADRLYALPPEEFTAARDEAVKAAREPETKKAVKALRKPVVAAAVVNRLVRDRRDDLDRLLVLGDDIRAAMASDPAEVRRLTEQRREAIAALVPSDLPAAAQEDVTATLEAGTADPELAAAVRSGRLVKPLRYAGFGTAVDIDDAVATPIAKAGAGSEKSATKPAKKTAPKSTAAKKTAAKKATPAPRPDPALTRAREQVLELAGAADDAQRRYESAVQRAVEARTVLDAAEAERAAAHKAARAAHAAAEKARRDLGKLERR